MRERLQGSTASRDLEALRSRDVTGVREQEPRARIQKPQALPDALATIAILTSSKADFEKKVVSDKLVRQVFRGAKLERAKLPHVPNLAGSNQMINEPIGTKHVLTL